jgi:nitroreductase
MDLKDVILKRRSIRIFNREKSVDKQTVLEILDVARWAPSHCNTQEVKFIVVDDEKNKRAIVDGGGSPLILTAPIGILITYSNRSDNLEYYDYVQSAAAVIQNLCLYAYTKGLGTCWINHLPSKKYLRNFFGIPETYDPIAYVMMGYPIRSPKNMERKLAIEEMISYNKFEFKLEQKNNISSRRFFRRLYYSLPTWIKRKINPFVQKHFVKRFEN